MTIRLLALLWPMLVHFHAMAQRPLPPNVVEAFSRAYHFESARDSLDYLHFTAGLCARPAELTTDTNTAGLRMAWRAAEFGREWYVKRGDGSPPEDLELRPFSSRLAMLTAEGKRALLVTEEYPCALNCHTVWYFMEE
jgi:hypothetical protein